jgi:hypothetical protein
MEKGREAEVVVVVVVSSMVAKVLAPLFFLGSVLI